LLDAIGNSRPWRGIIGHEAITTTHRYLQHQQAEASLELMRRWS
jgi:hypothetical protein